MRCAGGGRLSLISRRRLTSAFRLRSGATNHPEGMSLRGRITLVTALTLTVGLALAGVALNLLLASRLMADANAVLDNRAASLLATIDTSGSAPAVHDTAADAVLDEQAWVFGVSGSGIEHPPLRGAVAEEARALALAARPTRVSVNDEARLLAVPITDDRGARVGTVVVGVSLGRTSGRSTWLWWRRSSCVPAWWWRRRRWPGVPRTGPAAGGGHDGTGCGLERA